MAVSGKDVEYEFVEALPEELTCSICMKALREPYMVNCCEQSFCKECLSKWSRRNSSCPHCRSTDFSTFFRKQMNRKVSELKVYCPNKQHGCKAELKISEYDSHLSLTNNRGCSYVKLDCPNECLAKVFRGEMKAHTWVKCPRRVVSCEWCNSKGEYELIAGDHVKTCPSFPVLCPMGCVAKLVHEDLWSHHSTCPLELVPCLFSGLGCKTTVYRKDMDNHIETSTPQHMTMLVKSHTTLQAEHRALQTEHRALQTEHAELQTGHTALQNKLMAVTTLLSDKQIAKVHTILSESSTVTIGRSITLAVSDKPGYHYIILSQIFPKPDHKFKLEWGPSQGHVLLGPAIRFKLHFISEAAYPKMTTAASFDISFNSPDISFNSSFNSHTVQVTPHRKMQEDNSSTLISTFDLHLQGKPLMIKFSPHNCWPHNPHNRCSTQ